MSTIVLGCDENNGPSADAAFQNAVAAKLEKAGHTVEKLSITPGAFASYSYGENGENPKGKIGVYLIAAGITSIADLYDGNTGFKYGYIGIRGDVTDSMKTINDFNTKPISKDWHGDCTSRSCNSFAGKTFPQMNEVVKSKLLIVFGATGDEMGDNIIKAMGGEVSSDSENKGESTGSTAKECVQKLLTHWDGEAECKIRGDKVYINKIKEPQSNYSLILQEGVNVFSDSISITDINPTTVNHLIVTWTKGKIILKDEDLIKRFGENKKEVQAVRKIITTETVDSTSTAATAGTDTSTADLTATTGTDATTTDLTADTTAAAAAATAGTDATATGVDTGSTTKTKTIEEPIDNYKEALEFANTEWNKIKRDNGHTLECQVTGSNNWKVGEWVAVLLPSFDENCFMYTTRVSQSDNSGDWTCNLSLVDYPPGWGEEETEDKNNDDSDEAAGNPNKINEVVNEICREIGEFSYSGECSDADCIKQTKRGECWALSDYIYKRLKGAGIQAKIHQYGTSSAGNHRQVSYNNGSSWVMFPYSKSGIDHYFYTNEIPSDTEIIAS